MGPEDIHPSLKSLPLDGQKPEHIQIMMKFASDFMFRVESTLPPSRERSLAMTKIEEAAMWANKAISRS